MNPNHSDNNPTTLPIIFLHGLAGSKNNFLYFQEFFPTAVAFDLPGFGDEDKPHAAYDPDFFVQFLERKITTPCILVGHSMGGFIAKAFALRHPELVARLYLISYPLQATPKALLHVLESDPWLSHFAHNTWLGRTLCALKIVYKWPILLWSKLTNPKYFLSTRDYFRHTVYAESGTIAHTVLADDYHTLHQLGDRIFLIVGDHDLYVDYTLLPEFRHQVIPHMGHVFFHHEGEIARLITEDIRRHPLVA